LRTRAVHEGERVAANPHLPATIADIHATMAAWQSGTEARLGLPGLPA
jgi:hypothetical protein